MIYNSFITDSGATLLERGKELVFTRVEFGDGYSSTIDATTISLISKKMFTQVTRVAHFGDKLEVQTDVAPHQIPDVPFVFHEMGVYAKIAGESEFLFSYACREDGDVFDRLHLVERTFQFDIFVRPDAQISVEVLDSVEWVTKKQFYLHTENYANPHRTTKYQVGLGNLEDYEYITTHEIDTDVPLSRHMIHSDIKYMLDKYFKTHRDNKNAVEHNYTKNDIGLGDVPNYSEVDDIDLLDIELPSGRFITSQMLENCVRHLLTHSLINLRDFVDGDDIQYISKLQSGTNNIEVRVDDEGITRVSWVGSTLPKIVSWQDIVEGSPEKNTDLMKTLAKYATVDGFKAGTNIKLVKVPMLDQLGNATHHLQVHAVLPNDLVKASGISGKNGIVADSSGDRVLLTVDLGYIADSREMSDTINNKLLRLEEKLTQLINSKGGVKGVVSATPNTLQVVMVDGVAYISSSGGTGPAPDLTPYLKKTEAEATYAKLGHTHPGGGSVDLSGYYTKQEIDNEVSGYAKKSELRLVESGHVQDLLKINTIQGQHTEQIDALGKSVREGKASVAAAITSKGVPTSEDDTFMAMANSILNIPSGGGFVPPEYTTVAFWKDWTTISDSSYRIATSGGSSDFVIWKMIGPGNFILVPWKLPYCATNITVRYAYSTVIYTSKEGGESVNKTLDTATGDEKTFDYRLIPRCLSDDGKWVYGTSVTQSSILMKAPVGDLNDTRILTTGGVVMSSLKWIVGNDSTFVTQGGVYHINSTLSMVSYSGSLPTSGYAVVGSNILVHTSFYDYGVGGGNRYKVCKVVLDGSTATLVDFKTCIENGTPGKLYYGFHRGFSIIGDAIYNTDLLKVRDLVPIANYIPRGDYLVYGTSFVSKDTTRSINVSPLNNPVTCGYQGVKYIASNLNTSTKIVYITSVNATADQLDTLECEEDAVFTPNGMHVITKLKGGVRGVYTYPGKKFLRACNHAGTYKTLLSNDLTYIGTFQSTIQQWDGKKYVDLVHGESTSNNNLTAIDREFRYATSYDGWIYTLPECTRLGRPNGKPNAVIGDYLYCTEMSGNSVVGTWVYRITGSSLVLISTSTGIPTHRGEVLGTATYTRLGNSNQLYNLEDKTFHQLTDIHSDFKLSDSYATGYDGGIFCTSGYVLSLLEASKREALLRL